MNKIITAICAFTLLSAPASALDLTPDQRQQVKLKSAQWLEQKQKAEAFTKDRKFADAEAVYQKIKAERETLGLDLLSEYDALAGLYFAWGKPEQALKSYRDMVAAREKSAGASDPTLVYPLNELAACLKKLGRSAEAKAVLARVAAIEKEAETRPKFGKITSTPGSPERLSEGEKMRALGDKYMSCDQQAKARVYFDRAVALNPGDALALCGRADAESWSQDFARAKLDYTRAIQLQPKLAKAYVGRAYLREGQKQYQLAIADFDNAIALNGKDTETMGARAKLLDNMGKHKEAIAGYSRIIACDPSLYWPYIQRAVAYTATGQFKEAIADLTTIVDRAPGDPDYREYRGDAYFKAGQLQDALADYNKLIELSPKYAHGYRQRVKIYSKLDGKVTPRVEADRAMLKKLGA